MVQDLDGCDSDTKTWRWLDVWNVECRWELKSKHVPHDAIVEGEARQTCEDTKGLFCPSCTLVATY